jgi:branched-chain amino acid transport system substrate-binding protein
LLTSAATLVGLGAALPLLQACGGSGSSSSIRVGQLLPLSGPNASEADDILRGFGLYMDSIDWTVQGRKIEMIKADESSTPAEGVRQARKLMQYDDVNILTGVFLSGTAYALRDFIHEEELITIVSNAGGRDLTRAERRSPYLFRVSNNSAQQGFPMGVWVPNNVGKRVYLLAFDIAFGHEVADAFKANLANHGGTMVGETYSAFPTSDFGPYLGSIRGANPDVVFAVFSGSDAANFVKQYADFGLKGRIPLTGVGQLVSQSLLAAEGEAAVGIRSVIQYTPKLDTPENQAFLASYQAKYAGEPSYTTVCGYDAAQVIAQGIEQAGGIGNPAALAKVIEGLTIKSPRGPFQFDSQSHEIIQNMYVTEVRDVDGNLGVYPIATFPQVNDPGV